MPDHPVQKKEPVNMKHRLTIIVLLLALSVSLYFVNANSYAAPAAQTWEYKFEYHCDEKKANAFAADGWELVNMGVTSFGSLPAVHCAFKRAK